MTQAETGVLIECYRKIRAVASAVQDPKQITALNVACGALLVALGTDQECEKT